DFNAHFINSLDKKRVFFVVHHPYSNQLKKRFGIEVYPILGHQIFDNKFKRRFFKNPLFYVNLLSLRHYPDLTAREFQRLCIYLGCTKEQWDAIDNKKISVVPPYNSVDYPLLLSLLLYFSQGKNWFRYEVVEPRYYEEPGFLFIDRLFGGWWFNTFDDIDITSRQAFNELSEYDMPFFTFYLSCKN